MLAIRLHPLGIWPTAPASKSSTGSTTTPDTCCTCTAYRRVAGPDVVAELHHHHSALRPARLNTDRQRIGLHLTIHPRPQRLRTPTSRPGYHPEKRPSRPPSNPRQRSNASTKPSNAGSHHDPDPPPWPPCKTCSTTSPSSTTPNAATAPCRRAPHPHRPTTPAPKPHPPNTTNGHFRIRHDTVDQFGKLTLRHGSRLHHLGIGATHAAHPRTDPGHHHHRHRHQQNRPPRPRAATTSTPTKNYWRNQNKNPGRWPGNL